MTVANSRPFITAHEAAARAGKDVSTIHRWMNRDYFVTRSKDMRAKEIDEKSFDAFLAKLRRPTKPRRPIRHSTA